MPPRAEEPPRRGQQPRRGASRDVPPEDDEDGRRGFGGIGEARAYTPRGRTVAERDQRTRSPRAGRTTDPFRPALQVLDGGKPATRNRRQQPAVEDVPKPRPVQKEPVQREPEPGERAPREREPREREPRERELRERAPREREPREREPREREPKERAPRERAPRERARREPAKKTAVKRQPARGDAATRDRESGRIRAGAGGTRTRQSAEPRRVADGRPLKAAPPRRRPAPAIPAEPPRLANSTRRLRLGTVLALALFVIIGVRLVVLQVVESPESDKRLLRQRQDRLTEVVLPAPRGSILDRDGQVLAHSVEARYIYADPTLVVKPAEVAAKLSPLLGIAPSKLNKLMAKKTRPGGGELHFVYLARGVDTGVADKITAMNLKGINADRDERRDVPGADLAANLIGFTGEDHTGLEGLEAKYDELLRGSDGKRIYETGFGELDKEIPGGFHNLVPASPGTSLELTIDRDLQFEVQRILAEKMESVKAKVGGAVVIDVRTGEVLAQASYPAYDAQNPLEAKSTDREDVVSSVITDPGSTHKAFIYGAALEEGLITPSSKVVIGPALIRGDYEFKDTHPQPKGTKMPVAGLLAYSSNVGTILIGDRLGPQRIYEYQQKFGLGRATGEGMPGEAEGKLLAPDEWSGSASGSIPIGHSVDATLIQMAAGYATIANDGTYVQPHLIKATIPFNGPAVPAPPPATHPVLKPAIAAQLRTLMESVVDSNGATGRRAQVDGWRIAGKTGTGKRLIDGQYTSYDAGSFIGMAPADNPRYVIAVFADSPSGSGGDVAAPAFSEMMRTTLLHFKVPPSATPPPKIKIDP